MARNRGRDRDRDPMPLSSLLETLVAGRGWGDRMAVGELRGEWESIVGPQIARHSEPIALSRGTLTVRAEAGVWASELTLVAATLARKVDEHLAGRARVKTVKIVTGSIRASGGSDPA